MGKINELYRVTDKDMNIVMESVVKRILREGVEELKDMPTWDGVKEQVGAERMLESIWNCLNHNELSFILEEVVKDLDIE